MNLKNLALVVTLGLSIGLSAHAEKIKAIPKNRLVERVDVPVFDDPIMKDDFYQKIKNDTFKISNRDVAQAQVDNFSERDNFSESFRNLRNELIGGPRYANGQESGQSFPGVKSADDLDKLVQRYSGANSAAAFNLLDNDAKLIAIQLAALAPFKSFIYRAQTYFGQHTASRAAILTGLRMSAQTINIYFPTSNWKAGFSYVTEPMLNMGRSIESDSDLEAFIANELLPVVSENTKRMLSVASSDRAVWWDAKLYFTSSNFVSEKDRYFKLGVPELRLMMSAAYGSLAAVRSLAAYSLDGLSAATQETSQAFGIDVVSRLTPMDGITAKSRYEILKSHSQLFRLRSQSHMVNAYSDWQNSSKWAASAWGALKVSNNSINAQNILDASAVIPFARGINSTFLNIDRNLQNNGDFASAMVGGEVVKFNMREFFTHSPNLADLYPQKFEETTGRSKSKVLAGKNVTYRNYEFENATHWKLSAYQAYFPDLKADAANPALTKDISKQALVLSQSWGGWIVGLPLSNLLY